ncbi:MAG TPA: hypothetical protein VK907_03460, partial [Phnomibacter sp.]|nr:hypothetical protein [Phnomibacter sp.]
MKDRWIGTLLTLTLLATQVTFSIGQVGNTTYLKAKPRATIFIPLYLDSAFSEGKYMHGNSIPGHILNGLEFYNGVKLAADELETQGIPARIRVVDTKDPNYLEALFKDTTYEGMGIVISAAQSAAEFRAIAEKLKPLGTPLISMLPNDAGVTNYPNLMIANSTLKVHCQQLFRFVQRNHALDNLVMLTARTGAEARLMQYLEEANEATPGTKLNYKNIALGDESDETQLLAGLGHMLDSNRINVIVAPTLNTIQAQRIVRLLSTFSPSYATVVFGMPTWETVNFAKSEYRGVDVWYGSPFTTLPNNTVMNETFINRYKDFTNGRPGDMAYRAYEVTLRYLKTFFTYGPQFMDHINDARFQVFNEFDFQPVRTREAGPVDYRENQRIYFVKKTEGALKTV